MQHLVQSTQREVSGEWKRGEVGGGEEGEERRRRRREEEEEEGERKKGEGDEGEGSEQTQSDMEVKTHLSIENVSFETSSLLSCTLLARSSFSSHK